MLEKQLYNIFYNPKHKSFLVANDFLAVITVISIAALVLETVPSLANYQIYFNTVEYITVFFFTAEYIARVIAHGSKWRQYVCSWYGLIDLLSIVPTYLVMANLTFLKAARVFRIMQLLRMVRLAKVVRFGKHQDLEEQTTLHKSTLQIYFLTLFSAVLLFGTAMYVVENGTPEFASIPAAMLWTAKPLLGGVAQIEPTTTLGNIFVVLIRFTGLVLFGLLISMVGSSLRAYLLGDVAVSKSSTNTKAAKSVKKGSKGKPTKRPVTRSIAKAAPKKSVKRKATKVTTSASQKKSTPKPKAKTVVKKKAKPAKRKK